MEILDSETEVLDSVIGQVRPSKIKVKGPGSTVVGSGWA
jgi:hypothetical protein